MLKDNEVARLEYLFFDFVNNGVKLNTDRPILQQLSCSSSTLVCGYLVYKVYVGIHRGSLGAIKQ